MKLEVTGNEFSADVTEGEIDEALALLTGEEGEAFAILGESEMTYMQTSGWPEVGFDLEYQEGSLERHFRCTHEALTLPEVSRAFKQYLRGDSAFQRELAWERDEGLASLAGGKSGGTSRNWIFLLTLLALGILALWYLL